MNDNVVDQTSFSSSDGSNYDSENDFDTANNFGDSCTVRCPIGYAFEPVVSAADTASASARDSDQDSVSSVTETRTDNTRWCHCGYCAVMPSNKECLCCKEIGSIQHRVGTGCVTENPSFSGVCINQDVLEVSLLLMSDIRADTLTRPIASRYASFLLFIFYFSFEWSYSIELIKDCTLRYDIHSLVKIFDFRTLRLAAYRQFTLWAHGKLGRRVRRIIPSCVVHRIRSTYPEHSGIYHGFEYALFE